MKVLLLIQAASMDDISILLKSFPTDTEFIMLTGSEIEFPQVKIIKTTSHDSSSLLGRLRCWCKYYLEVSEWVKKEGKLEHFDLIYGNSNPPINSILGVKLKKMLHTPYIYMNWDIYPQIIEESYSNIVVKAICKLWHRINNINYPKIERMLTIAPIMADSINKPLNKKIEIGVVPIACDVETLKPIPKINNTFVKEQGLFGKFIALYSGKLGYGHNISAILGAAELLRDYKDIVFLFIGKGPRCAEVKNYIDSGGTNVKLLPLQPNNVFPYSMASGDIGLVSQEESLAHLFLPSKTFSMMACGMPVIGLCSEKDDLNHLITESGTGIPVIHADANKVADAVLQLYKDAELRRKMGEKARNLIKNEYSEEAVAKKYRDEIYRILR